MAINLPPLANGIQLINTGLTPNDRQGDLLPVAFEKINQNFMLAVTKNEDSFTGPITMEQTLTVMGQATFNQQVIFNQTLKAYALAEFRGEVKFFEKVTLEEVLVANAAAEFNRTVVFNDNVTFNDPVHFEHTANFNGAVNLPAGSVRPQDLDVMNSPTNDLVLGYNSANGRFTWRVQTGEGGVGISSVGLGDINAAGAGADKLLKINPQGNGLVWSASGEGGISSVALEDINAVGAAPTRVLSVNASNDGLIWQDVAEQQSVTFQNLQQMILHQGENARMSGRGIALIQNQSGIRVHNYILPLGVASNLDPVVEEPEEPTPPIEPEPLSFVNQSISNAVVGRPYRAEIELQGGIAPYYWMLQSDTPEGLDLPAITSRARNYISGTPTVIGNNTFSVRVQDSSDPRREVLGTFSLEVEAAPLDLTIITSQLREIKQGVLVSLPLEAANGTGPYTWSLQAGTLPTGLTLDVDSITADTVISGTSTQAGEFTITVRVTDSLAAVSNKTYTLVVEAEPIAMLSFAASGSALPTAVIGLEYSHSIVVSGGRAPYYYNLDSVAPPGLYLSSDMDYTPHVHVLGYSEDASPTNHTLSIRVTDSSPVPQVISRNFTLSTISPPLTLQLLTTALPAVLSGDNISIPLISTSGTGAHVWSISVGSLPAGVVLQTSDVSTAALTGVAPAPGNYSFTIRVQDAAAGDRTAAVTLSVAAPPLHHTTASLPLIHPPEFAVVGRPFSQSAASVIGYEATNKARISAGSLPPGLSLDANSYITGTPTTAGSYKFLYTQYTQYAKPTGLNWLTSLAFRWTAARRSRRYPYHRLYLSALLARRVIRRTWVTMIVKPATFIDIPISVTKWLPTAVKGMPYSARIEIDGVGIGSVNWTTLTGFPSWMTVQRNDTFLRITGVVPENLSVADVYHPRVVGVVGVTTINMAYIVQVQE